MWEDGKLVFSIISALAVVKKPSFSCFCSVDLSLGEAAWNFCEKKKEKKRGFFAPGILPLPLNSLGLILLEIIPNYSPFFLRLCCALSSSQIQELFPALLALERQEKVYFFWGGRRRGRSVGTASSYFLFLFWFFFDNPNFVGFSPVPSKALAGEQEEDKQIWGGIWCRGDKEIIAFSILNFNSNNNDLNNIHNSNIWISPQPFRAFKRGKN